MGKTQADKHKKRLAQEMAGARTNLACRRAEESMMGDASLKRRYFRPDARAIGLAAMTLLIATGGLTGCTTGEVFHNGYIVDPKALDLVPVGASREQVLLSLGTPSTTATFDGEVFYYISQTRKRPVAFMKQQLVDQQVLAIYFDKKGTVVQRANYSMKDGKVFDMVSRTTPTGGKDLSFLQQILSGGNGAANSVKNMLGFQ